MSLFHTSDIGKKNTAGKLPASSVCIDLTNSVKTISTKASKLIAALVGEVGPDKLVEFNTAGEFSFHQVIEYLVTITGASDLYLSTWTIKEDPARALFNLKQKGLLKGLYCVFDHRIRTHDAKHYYFIEKICTEIKLTSVHAKVAVLIGDKCSLVMTTSANMSNNPRIEVGTISGHDKLIEFHLGWITNVLQGKKGLLIK